MQRFFLSPRDFENDTVTITDPELVHQFTRVLRLQVGALVILLDNTNTEYKAKITNIRRNTLALQVVERYLGKAEPRQKLTLYQALPKSPAKLEQIVQHGTEVGITRFVPLLTERTEVQSLRNITRLKKIIRESAEQSERGILPELSEPVGLQELLKNPPEGVNLIGDSFGSPPLLATLLPKLQKAMLLNIFIGPEGGFSESEIKVSKKVGVLPCSLGPRILRTETAGVAVASAILFG